MIDTGGIDGLIQNYVHRLTSVLSQKVIAIEVPKLASALLDAWNGGRSIYICGNGGSAANAIHIANDFIYGAGLRRGKGLRIEALCSNQAVMTCLANDVGYDEIFSSQLAVKGGAGDVLIALSGSGNSPNIIKAIETAKSLHMQTFAILGYQGGRCKSIVDVAIHFEVDDMQVAEDVQLVVAHICMQWLGSIEFRAQ